MRPMPLPASRGEPTAALVVLVEPVIDAKPRRRRRPLSLRSALPALGPGLALALGLGLGAWSTQDPQATLIPVAGAHAVSLGAASVGVDGPLFPGGEAALSLPVSNPNPFPVHITAVSLTSQGCSDAALRLAHPLVIPAGPLSRAVIFPGAVRMGLAVRNDCQGQVLRLTLSGVKARR